MLRLCVARGSSLTHPKICALRKLSEQASSGTVKKKRRWFRTAVLVGAGAVGAGVVLQWVLEWRYQAMLRRLENAPPPAGGRKKLVVLGSGWGALSILQHLEPGAYDVHVVSPRNYFLFTPLLPSVTVGTVEARSIAAPIRKILTRLHGRLAYFYEAECTAIDQRKKVIHCQDTSGVVGEVSKFELPYDMLVLAVGAETNTMNVKGVEENAHFLKEIEDARKIRTTIMDNVETAYLPGQTQEERQRLLHFVIVGGGPTGVEFAAELRDFLQEDLVKLYPDIADVMRISVVQSRDHVLNTYDSEISEYTRDNFEKHGHKIKILANCRVVGVGAKDVTVMDKTTRKTQVLPAGLCVWSAGIQARPLTKQLIGDTPGQTNRHALVTDSYMRVKNARGIFAIGDCATEDQAVLSAQAEQLFKEADIDNSGSLTFDEFQALMEKAQRLYPHVSMFFAKAKKSVSDGDGSDAEEDLFKVADKNKDNTLDMEEFREVLRQVDRTLTSYPATAQVAGQEGRYLGRLLNSLSPHEVANDINPAMVNLKPFHYQHMGSFAYVGDNRAVLQVPVFGAMKGWWTMWLWRAFYASELASNRTRCLVVFDWCKSYVFGRDSSRV